MYGSYAPEGFLARSLKRLRNNVHLHPQGRRKLKSKTYVKHTPINPSCRDKRAGTSISRRLLAQRAPVLPMLFPCLFLWLKSSRCGFLRMGSRIPFKAMLGPGSSGCKDIRFIYCSIISLLVLHMNPYESVSPSGGAASTLDVLTRSKADNMWHVVVLAGCAHAVRATRIGGVDRNWGLHSLCKYPHVPAPHYLIHPSSPNFKVIFSDTLAASTPPFGHVDAHHQPTICTEEVGRRWSLARAIERYAVWRPLVNPPHTKRALSTSSSLDMAWCSQYALSMLSVTLRVSGVCFGGGGGGLGGVYGRFAMSLPWISSGTGSQKQL